MVEPLVEPEGIVKLLSLISRHDYAQIKIWNHSPLTTIVEVHEGSWGGKTHTRALCKGATYDWDAMVEEFESEVWG